MKAKPRTIAEYLAPLGAEQRAALERLRNIIRVAHPKAEECISYGLPGFRLDGRMLVWFGAATKHCALYPGVAVESFEKELASYGTSKGTIRFQPEKPLPAVLVRKLLKERIARSGSPRPRTKGVARSRRAGSVR